MKKENQLFMELSQDKEKTFILIHQIMNSRRLLSDHLEILEEAYLDTENERIETNYVTFTKTGIFGAVSYLSTQFLNQYKFVLPSISLAYFLMLGVKFLNKGRNIIFKGRIDELIKSLNDFDLCVKRSLIFFNETLYFKANSSKVIDKVVSENEIVQNCLHTIILVSKSLYNKIRNIEKNYPLSSKYNVLYQSLENLDDCEYFNKSVYNFGVKDAKAFYNIFSYIQSQCLLRLGLSFFSSTKTIEVNSLTNFINEQTTKDSNRLDFLLSQMSSQKQIHETLVKKSPTSINYLKSNSLYLTSKIIALTLNIRHLDNIIQNIDESIEKEELINVNELIISIGNSMIICDEEFKRLSLNYQKMLNFKYELPLDPTIIKVSENLNNNINETKNISEKTLIPIKDDFFALDSFDNENQLSDYYGHDNDFLNISKITKSYFKPVLSQLKEKIGPIGEKMKQKEREILAAKGIQIKDDDFGDINQNDDNANCFLMKKNLKTNKKYEDNREFLVRKEQIHILPCLPTPTSSFFEEDILE